MLIEQYIERRGLRFRLTAQSLDGPTHSLMTAHAADVKDALWQCAAPIVRDLVADETSPRADLPDPPRDA